MTSVRIEVEPARTITSEQTVCHYDQLPEVSKNRLWDVVSGEQTVADVGPVVALQLITVDVVKFTDYYAVSVV